MHPGHSIGAVYLYRPAIDFRKSIGGLSALVEQELGLNPFGDALYLFINRRRDKLKALYCTATASASGTSGSKPSASPGRRPRQVSPPAY